MENDELLQRNYYSAKLAWETDSWDLKEALDAGKNVVVIDARSAEAFECEHIPFAINIPHRTIDEESTSGIDRSALVVSYCDGIGCNASTRAALKLVDLGFQVKELLGGLDWWKRDGHSTHHGRSPGTTTDCGCG